MNKEVVYINDILMTANPCTDLVAGGEFQLSGYVDTHVS